MAWDWGTLSVVVGVVVPLLGAPLTLITLYLRSIREHQVERHASVTARFHRLDEVVENVAERLCSFERDYTTKEEWLRESMHARTQLDKLTELVTRVQVELENGNGLAHHFAQATQAMVRLTEALVERSGGGKEHD